VIKLIDRKQDIPFEEKASSLYESMRQAEFVFDLYHGFIEKTKERHNFVFYPEAYAALQRMADDCYPLDTNFINRGVVMDETLFRIDTFSFPQYAFVEYMENSHRSTQIYSVDFLQDVFNYYVYEVVKEVEKRSIQSDYPEYDLTMKSYYDGTLLFEISNKRVWSRPPEDQARLEAEWVNELTEKFPVTIDWKVIKKIKNVS
jgi:peptidyl-prolyl cis-trans isomerase SurA